MAADVIGCGLGHRLWAPTSMDTANLRRTRKFMMRFCTLDGLADRLLRQFANPAQPRSGPTPPHPQAQQERTSWIRTVACTSCRRADQMLQPSRQASEANRSSHATFLTPQVSPRPPASLVPTTCAHRAPPGLHTGRNAITASLCADRPQTITRLLAPQPPQAPQQTLAGTALRRVARICCLLRLFVCNPSRHGQPYDCYLIVMTIF